MPRYPAIHQLWALGSPLLLTRVAWAARSTAYRGQWTLGDLIGTMRSCRGACGARGVFLLAAASVLATKTQCWSHMSPLIDKLKMIMPGSHRAHMAPATPLPRVVSGRGL